MSNEIRLADLVVDCPDAIKLSQFYHELLGWKTTELFGNPAVVSENGVMLVFVQEMCIRDRVRTSIKSRTTASR